METGTREFVCIDLDVILPIEVGRVRFDKTHIDLPSIHKYPLGIFVVAINIKLHVYICIVPIGPTARISKNHISAVIFRFGHKR
jgi:hypothetical protein